MRRNQEGERCIEKKKTEGKRKEEKRRKGGMHVGMAKGKRGEGQAT